MRETDHPPEEERFRALYDAHFDAITGFVRRRADDPHDAADAVAETFLVAWRRLADVPPGEQARYWLYRVARNTLANQRRGEHRRRDLAARVGAELGGDLAAAAPADDGPGGVAAAFRGLRDGDRELLSLVAWEGLDAGEIAAVLGVSRNAVRIRLHRARRRFARELEQHGVAPAVRPKKEYA
ncbi:RNA polymerase sigma factor [Actinomadura atramentaria]|uniref:RNA polymerase sigma factor n=1 Tax=Actinomadura atramentaria TaxID=1990 RepID=UPI00037C4059|nr:sigma-70 family RNA polymerase sigma factor [Actinomadura atramentaria]